MGDIKALHRQRMSCRTWGVYLYQGLRVECFWGCSQTKTGLGDLNQKELGFVKFLGRRSMSYLKDSQGVKVGGRRDYLSPGALHKSSKELTLICDSVGCYLGHGLQGGASVSSRPQAGYLVIQNGCQGSNIIVWLNSHYHRCFLSYGSYLKRIRR